MSGAARIRPAAARIGTGRGASGCAAARAVAWAAAQARSAARCGGRAVVAAVMGVIRHLPDIAAVAPVGRPGFGLLSAARYPL
ncbi:hypothetical protein GCM10020218_097620 [Dactylosporangium vinaceum]